MPLLGLFTGSYVGHLLGQVTTFAAGGLLILLGGHMVFNSFRAGHAGTRSMDHQTFWGMLLISLSVSVDSFSVGVSLGMFVNSIVLTVLAFGACGVHGDYRSAAGQAGQPWTGRLRGGAGRSDPAGVWIAVHLLIQ